MDGNISALLSIAVTKPKGKVAVLLTEMGIDVCPIEDDEGNVDRYVLSDRVAVERRTGSAFLRGIQDKTLFTSAIFLREHFAIPILIIEGKVNYEFTLFNPQAIRGALTSMMLEYGINVLTTTDLDETVSLLGMLARQEQIGIPDISLIPKRKAVDLPDLQCRVVEMLPGCYKRGLKAGARHWPYKGCRNVQSTSCRVCGFGYRKESGGCYRGRT